MGVKEKPNADLTSFIPELDETVVDEPWKKHWKEMPEYKQEEKRNYKTIQLHFRNKEDFDEFCQKYSAVDPATLHAACLHIRIRKTLATRRLP